MVNMREHSDILYWYLGSKKNIQILLKLLLSVH